MEAPVKLLILCSLFTLASCATYVKKVGTTSKYAPANYQEVGSVQYELGGADWIVEKRKDDAFKTMYDACNGNYEIVREGRKSEFMAIPASQSGLHYIEFKCKQVTASN
jgi:hypothetical protein